MTPVFSLVARSLIDSIFRTSRFKVLGNEAFVLARLRAAKPLIFAHWHSSILGSIGYFLRLARMGYPIATVASQSKDGEIISRILRDITRKAKVVRGSSRKGGHSAFNGLLETLESGCSVVITVDGPLGPKYESKSGAVRLASLTGVPIVPFEFCARNEYYLRASWDNSRFALPFNTGFYLLGEPIYIHNEISPFYFWYASAMLDKRLRELTAYADAYVKRSKPIF